MPSIYTMDTSKLTMVKIASEINQIGTELKDWSQSFINKEGLQNLAMGLLINSPCQYLATYFHEKGHQVTYQMLEKRAATIKIFPGFLFSSGICTHYKTTMPKDFLITAAGPIAGVAGCAVTLAALTMAREIEQGKMRKEALENMRINPFNVSKITNKEIAKVETNANSLKYTIPIFLTSLHAFHNVSQLVFPWEDKTVDGSKLYETGYQLLYKKDVPAKVIKYGNAASQFLMLSATFMFSCGLGTCLGTYPFSKNIHNNKTDYADKIQKYNSSLFNDMRTITRMNSFE